MDKSQLPPLYPPMDEMGPPPPYFLEGEIPAQAPPMEQWNQQPYLDPPGYPHPPQQPQEVVLTTPPLINSHNPLRMQCPHCKEDVKTIVNRQTGLLAHVAAAILCPFCLVFCCIPCCVLPYCLGNFKDTIHQCPKCRKHIGFVKRL